MSAACVGICAAFYTSVDFLCFCAGNSVLNRIILCPVIIDAPGAHLPVFLHKVIIECQYYRYGDTRKTIAECENVIIRRGDIFYADLRPVVGSEQGGVRPVLIIQNDVGNKHSPTVICAAITSKMNKAKLPTHVELNARQCDMVKDSVILLEQLRTIDKRRLREKICHIDGELGERVDMALKISLDLPT